MMATITAASAYLNVHINVNRTGDLVSYMVPLKIDGHNYQVPITFEDADQFLKTVSEKMGSKKKHRSGVHK